MGSQVHTHICPDSNTHSTQDVEQVEGCLADTHCTAHWAPMFPCNYTQVVQQTWESKTHAYMY